MKLSARLAAAVLPGLLVSASPAFASNQSGNVTLTGWAGGRFFVTLSGARTGTVPSCSCCNRFEVTSSTDAGRTLIAMFLTAQGTGKPANIVGSGACVAGSNDTEGITIGEVIG